MDNSIMDAFTPGGSLSESWVEAVIATGNTGNDYHFNLDL